MTRVEKDTSDSLFGTVIMNSQFLHDGSRWLRSVRKECE